MPAHECALGQHRKTIAIDAQPQAGGLGELPEARGDATFGGIVQCVHLAGFQRQASILHYADTGTLEESGAALQFLPIHHAGEGVRLVTGNERGPFHGDALGEDDGIAFPCAGATDDCIVADLSEHLADDNRPVQAVGDFRVAAAKGYVELAAGRGNLLEYRLHELRCRFVLR